MKTILTLLALLVLATPALAGDMGIYIVRQDRNARDGTGIGSSLYTNEAAPAAGAAVSASCPAPAMAMRFDVGASEFRVKANGVATPTTAGISNGNGWRRNPSEMLDINKVVSGTLISYWAVYSAAASNTVPYTCYAE